MAETVSSQIYKSRSEIRNQLINLLKEYLELENVDLTKSSFLSFIIDSLSVLSSNIIFYQLSTYKEFFLTKAQLPESIYNLAAFIGYTPKEAVSANINILFTIPFKFDNNNIYFEIPENFQVKSSDGIVFSTYYKTEINVINNSSVKIVIKEDNRVYILPVNITSDSFSFILPMKQYKKQIQEFQLSEDIKEYQFVTLDVNFDDQLSSLSVKIKPETSLLYETYIEYPSLFLMNSSTKGFIKRKTDNGISLQFGNGLIGYQPPPGSNVIVELNLTNGANGNVIAGSIVNGDRIYVDNGGITEIVQYEIINPSPAYNGDDEESIEDIRKNAIANLSSMKRLVSENDFKNADVVIKDSPIGPNSLPILKRSDLKVNEITLFSTIFFNNELVPTRDVYYNFNELYIPRETVITFDDEEYYTLLDMTIDPLNSVANYRYIMYEIEQVPYLITNYGIEYDLYADKITIKRDNQSAIFTLDYKTSENDYDLITCTLKLSETGATYNMTNDGTSFVYTFINHNIIPDGEINYIFELSHPTYGVIAKYSTIAIFKKDLSDFTMSTALPYNDGTSSDIFTIYDIPVIKKSYYDSIDKKVFELQVLQSLMTTISFKKYRMLTDFVSFKFTNTTGQLKNMNLNKTDKNDVIDILCSPPIDSTSLIPGDMYIIDNGQDVWEGNDGNIAQYNSDGTNSWWIYIEPSPNDIIYVKNKNQKYIYVNNEWVDLSYSIPLKISIDVFKDDEYTKSINTLIVDIKNALLEAFKDRFGIEIPIYRSEIIDIIHNVDGVKHCQLNEPKSDIFFNFDIDSFSQDELLQYSPEYIYFTEDDITIRIF